MKILKISGLVVLVLIGLIVVLGLVSPKEFKVEKSISIPTKNKEVIFKNISSWPLYLKWNPWMRQYPNQKITFKGEDGQIGSSYTWEGNKDAGRGKLTLTGLIPNKKVEMDLDFIEPWEANNKVVFTIKPEVEGCHVTWEMSGSSPFPLNIMHLFMDKMIGPDFEKGLNYLKEQSLKDAQIRAN